MNQRSLHIVFISLLIFYQSYGQFDGGQGDGYGKLIHEQIINLQSGYCMGGSTNGYDFLTYEQQLNLQPAYCSGGNGDGYLSLESSSIINQQSGYCSGGNNDGYHLAQAYSVLNYQTYYCAGGEGDGYFKTTHEQLLNLQSAYCFGGFHDGYESIAGVYNLNQQSFYCYGGIAQGYKKGTGNGLMNDQVGYCNGGTFNGYFFSLFNGPLSNQNFLVGGSGDGGSVLFTSEIPMGNGIWVGDYDINWENAFNWKNDVVPDLNVTVTIPDNCNFYPELVQSLSINSNLGYHQVSRIDVLPGGELYSESPVYVNGTLNIGGLLHLSDSTPGSMLIQPNGAIEVNSGGTMILIQD